MLKKWQLAVGSIVLSALMVSGCALTLLGLGAAAGIGTYRYVEGTMEKDYPRPMQSTYQACMSAASTMGLRVAQQHYSPVDSRIEAVQPSGSTVKIQLVARPNNITTVKVRFGLMGNEDQSAYFHRLVMDNLGIK
ncbi:MAG: DUF3568 family protein [Deltaproteobacteria bacterium]|nr:DUF3568 family protein [Deltaproteobacteria bacterium]